jgi:hypothetical protein
MNFDRKYMYETMRDCGIPPYMRDGLYMYVVNRVPPGNFLSALLSNDLNAAITRADDTNVNCLPNYMRWLYNYAPTTCYGSPEAFQTYLNNGRTI